MKNLLKITYLLIIVFGIPLPFSLKNAYHFTRFHFFSPMIHGVYTALITPFNQHQQFDETSYKKIIQEQIDAGVEGIVPMGTTGESPTVTHEENIEIIASAIKAADGKIQVMAGTGSNSTSEAVYMTQKAAELGADSALLVAPYYNKPSQEGLYRHFKAIAKAAPDLPQLLYNVPGRSGVLIEAETILRLAKIPNIVGVKDATGNLDILQKISGKLPAEFSVISGDDNLTVQMMKFGATGVISVASNLRPIEIKTMVDAARAGDFETAEKISNEQMPFFEACFCEANPMPIKTMMAMAGKCEEVFRLPLCELSDENKKRVGEFI